MKVNFLVENLGASQLSYCLTKTCNELVGEGYDIIVFFDKMHRHHIEPHFATMQLVEAWGQPGITIATSVATAVSLLDFPGPQRKLYYVWDMEWVRAPQWAYGSLADLFQHPDLSIITRNPVHDKVISGCFNITPHYIMDNFNIVKMREILQDESQR